MESSRLAHGIQSGRCSNLSDWVSVLSLDSSDSGNIYALVRTVLRVQVFRGLTQRLKTCVLGKGIFSLCGKDPYVLFQSHLDLSGKRSSSKSSGNTDVWGNGCFWLPSVVTDAQRVCSLHESLPSASKDTEMHEMQTLAWGSLQVAWGCMTLPTDSRQYAVF